MYLIRTVLFICVSYCFCSTSLYAARSQTIAALFVGDTKGVLGNVVMQDVQYIQKAIKNMAKSADMNLVATTLTGTSVSKEQIQKWLKQLDKKSYDVIFIYLGSYTLKKNPQDKEVFLTFFPQKQMLSLESTLHALDKSIILKRPRLSIVLYDLCCLIPETMQANAHMQKKAPCLKAPPPKYCQEGIVKLLKQSSGNIRIASWYPSFARQSNSALTQAFVDSIEKQAQRKQKTSWQAIASSTKQICTTAYHSTRTYTMD